MLVNPSSKAIAHKDVRIDRMPRTPVSSGDPPSGRMSASHSRSTRPSVLTVARTLTSPCGSENTPMNRAPPRNLRSPPSPEARADGSLSPAIVPPASNHTVLHERRHHSELPPDE